MSDQKTEQKHAPGPWRYWPCKVDSTLTPPMYDYVQFASPIGHVFRAPIQFLSEADARLIVAAPELLEALREAVERERNPFEPDNQSRHHQKWSALIAKATGERHD